MSEINELLQEFPEESRAMIRALWQSVSPEKQQELLALIPILPGQPGKLHKLFELSHKQMQMSFGDKHDVAIIGPANVGKSTLFNKLIGPQEKQAEVGPIPGTTRTNQEGSAGPFRMIDTPGADAVGQVGAKERALALEAAAAADFLVIMFDAVQGVKRTEQELFYHLHQLVKPFIVVLNKMDLVDKRKREGVIAKAAENLGLAPEQIIPISAEKGDDLERLVTAIVKAEPQLIAALGRGLPAYRWQLAWRVITGAASTAGLVALTPLPFVDFIPLLGIQVSLILGVARIYNYQMTLSRAREIAGVFGAGFLARTLFYELSKLGGPPGWALAAAVAAGTTVAIGYGSILWFERGEQLTREAAGRISRTVANHLLDALKSLGSDKPSRQSLSDRIREALDQSPLAEDRSQFDDVATN